ncbi:MAG TPA: bifunctional YncE family protein/alkaline phosphatase family protein [Candidatus Saccharimonadales bacterium]|jgi:DNA-binding beta-propeller fold protein YncE|nr:bifunctional YncE family protein/alkaline phosphatase family protein [Candidatus Saccharimonadales bacterium]
MYSLRICRLVFFTLLCVPVFAQTKPPFNSPLPTGVRLDPAGEAIELGSLPINLILAPEKDRAVVVLSGWREQGIQVVDLKTRKVTQTLLQDGAFYGAAFSPDGHRLCVSGGNTDKLFLYTWKDGAATLEDKFELAKAKTVEGTGTSYPAGLAFSPNGKFIYAVEDAGDRLAVVNAATGEITQRFPTDHYPYSVALTAEGQVFVSAWGGSTVSQFRILAEGTLAYLGRIEVGRHPSALAVKGTTLYVALAGSDRVAVVDTNWRKVVRYLHDAAPGAPPEGSTPNAVALTSGGKRLLVAEADNNAIAVFDITTGRLLGRIPTDWYPTAIAEVGGQLFALSGKGHGTHANPDGPVPLTNWPDGKPAAYALGQLNGTLRMFPASLSPPQLARFTGRVAAANHWQHRPAARRYPPFRHVVYIIKENRTYDQILGDMKEGDGDPGLVYFPDITITPNHHALARRFGLFDRFFVNAEVSSQGHIWSTAAYVTNYGEKVVPSGYAGKRADVDGEESDEPERGFLWTLATREGITFRDYGEMVKGNPGWPVTQRDLGADVNPDYAPMDFVTQDQKRADVWIAELQRYERDGNMPQLEVVWLPMDHLAAGRPGKCTPRACMADNDLALGRIVQALSHSRYWKDTVIFVVEDDAQAGPDHTDSHRAPFYAISTYNRPGTVHRFINTTDVVAAIEDILDMGRLSKFDYFSRSLAGIFAPAPDLTPYDPIVPTQDLNEKNPENTQAARLSEGMDLSAPDRADDQLYNQILWLMLKGDVPPPVAHSHAALHALQSSK